MCHIDAAPAAGSQCPDILFTAENDNGWSWEDEPNAETAAPISIGSPSGVPVPCISSTEILEAWTPAFCIAILITYVTEQVDALQSTEWQEPFGAGWNWLGIC